MKRLILTLAAILTLAVPVAAQQATPAPMTATDPFPATYGTHPIGEEVLIGTTVSGLRLTATAAQSLPRITPVYGDPIIARGQFITIQFTAVMEQPAPTRLDFTRLQLFDAATQRTYTVDDSATNQLLLYPPYGTNTYGDLQPGLPYQLVAVFDVPMTSADLWWTDDTHDFLVPLAGSIAAAIDTGTPVATPIT